MQVSRNNGVPWFADTAIMLKWTEYRKTLKGSCNTHKTEKHGSKIRTNEYQHLINS
jgi:hypothetical protein